MAGAVEDPSMGPGEFPYQQFDDGGGQTPRAGTPRATFTSTVRQAELDEASTVGQAELDERKFLFHATYICAQVLIVSLP